MGLPKDEFEGPMREPSREALLRENLQLKKALAQAEVRIAQAAERLARSEERTELILKATNDGVYEWDLLSDQLSCNESFFTLIGYSPAEIESPLRVWFRLLHPEDAGRVQQRFENALAQGKSHWMEEYRLQRKDGSYTYLLDQGYVVYNSQKKPLRMVGTLQDISERKEAELSLNGLSQEYAHLLDEIPVHVFSTLPDGGADFVNQRWLEYTGLSREEVLGQGWAKALHPLDVEPTFHSWQTAVQQGRKYQFQYRLQRKDGIYHWFQVDVVPYKDREGNILKWFGTCTNIEEVKQAQEALQQSMQLLQEAKAEAEGQLNYFYSLLLAIPSPIAIVRGESHTLEFFNPQLKNLLGNSLQLSEPLQKCLEGLPAKDFLALVQQVYHSGESRLMYEMPIYIREAAPDQISVAYHNLLFQAIHDQAGRIQGVMIFGHDITQQVWARKKVEESRTRVESILEGIPAMAWTTDVKGNNTYYNSRWYSYCGIPFGEQVNTFQFIHPEDALTIASSWLQAQQTIRTWEGEYRLLRADGTYRWHLGRTVPVFDSDGSLMEWFGVGTDIEEQKQTQQKLEKTLAQLHEKNFELDQFVYKTSHDLRAPLTSILGLVNIIKAEKEETTKMGYVDLIEGRVQKLDTFIQSMLHYSRNTRTPIQSGKIDFAALIKECLQELSSQRHFTRLHVSTNLAGENFCSDLFRLKILFSNLFSNAIKYQDFAKQESYLSISIQVSPQQAQLVFADNGVGIPTEHQPNIFNMFFRASEQAEGSGLGLYIVKQAVGVLKGEITLESQPGKGTSFQIILPNDPMP